MFRVTAGHRFPDGRLARANAGSYETRWYDASGRHLHSAGSRGEGPGEFLDISGMWPLAGDSLWVFDSRLRRVSILGPEMRFERSFLLGEGVYRFPHGVLADGTALVQVNRAFKSGEDEGGLDQAPVTLELYSPLGRFETELGEWPGSEMFVSPGDDFMIVDQVVFGRELHHAAGADHIAIGYSDQPSFTGLDLPSHVRRDAST